MPVSMNLCRVCMFSSLPVVLPVSRAAYLVFSSILITTFYLCWVACLVFCSILITTFLLDCSSFYKFNRHLCHGAYWCKHNPVNIGIIPWHLYLPFSTSRVCVSKHVCCFASLFEFFFFRNLIDTCVTVSIDVIYSYSYPNPVCISTL